MFRCQRWSKPLLFRSRILLPNQLQYLPPEFSGLRAVRTSSCSVPEYFSRISCSTFRRNFPREARKIPAEGTAADSGEVFGNGTGRSSNRAKPGKFRRKVLQLIREKYSGTEQERFGPTLAAEHLADEDGLEVGEETLRRWMLAEGLWSRIRRRKAHRKRRERRPYFGDLVQLDGSFHSWFEERGARGCLMNMVDDATGTTCARLGGQETI